MKVDLEKVLQFLVLNGKLHQFMVQPNGEPFRCRCGCNVFLLHKPDKNNLKKYECNACGDRYTGE